jgi:hypothetical protein
VFARISYAILGWRLRAHERRMALKSECIADDLAGYREMGRHRAMLRRRRDALLFRAHESPRITVPKI